MFTSGTVLSRFYLRQRISVGADFYMRQQGCIRKRVVVQFENTPKAFANPSPGFERSENPGTNLSEALNPVRVPLAANPFRVERYVCFGPRVGAKRSSPGLKLANAFGVFQTDP